MQREAVYEKNRGTSLITPSMEEQARLQSELRDTERHQRKLRQEIFEVEDRILAKRDELVQAIKSKLKPAVTSQTLFTIHWRIVASGVEGTVAG